MILHIQEKNVPLHRKKRLFVVKQGVPAKAGILFVLP
jgi:hypothetical protein